MTFQLEGDRRLLKFSTYEGYLDSMVTCTDLDNLQSSLDSRIVAELGYRSTGVTLSKEQFYKRLQAVQDYLFPKFKPTDLVSKRVVSTDVLMQQLASREEGNRTGKLATIIFLRDFTKTGFEVSAYIDFADRLQNQNWEPLFQGKKRLKPSLDDLSFYHWRNNTIVRTNSLNFKVLISPVFGLQFQCWHDRKVINANPMLPMPWHTTRTTVSTDRYEHIVLYDHDVRRRC